MTNGLVQRPDLAWHPTVRESLAWFNNNDRWKKWHAPDQRAQCGNLEEQVGAGDGSGGRKWHMPDGREGKLREVFGELCPRMSALAESSSKGS